ncbi:MAG: hypothetical protein Q7S23_01605 [bacterium]|nr:hypothetical protein [bacterium]
MSSHNPFREIIDGLGQSRQVAILGITGQAGAGKTTHIGPCAVATAHDLGFDSFELPLDAFFILSSRQRKLWLAEGDRVSPKEGVLRRDQLRWWDFERAGHVLRTLRNGDGVHLKNVYNRADGGELTGEIIIPPTSPSRRRLIVFDGVAIPELRELIDGLLFVHAPAPVRLVRLRERDRHRKGTEVLERFKLTQEFEISYFRKRWAAIDHFVDNSEISPQMLALMSVDTALADDGIPSELE